LDHSAKKGGRGNPAAFLLSVRRQARETTAPHCRQHQQQRPDVIGVADPVWRFIAARINRYDLKR